MLGPLYFIVEDFPTEMTWEGLVSITSVGGYVFPQVCLPLEELSTFIAGELCLLLGITWTGGGSGCSIFS